MEATISATSSDTSTQTIIDKYFSSGHDVQYLAEDSVFTDMGNGKQSHGRDEIKDLLNYMYHVAFDAKAEITNKVFCGNKAVMEFNFRGKHIGEFSGIMPSNKEVNVPICVVYDLENNLIKKARIYLLSNTLIKQLTAN